MSGRPVPGVALAVVKSTPDEQGRVEIEYRTLPDHRRPRAPIATPLAGGGRGLYFMPEIDDDVLVAFDKGDSDHPYIIGFLWDGVERPPETDRKNRVIVTPGGHQLRFEDGKGKVVVKSSGGHTVELDDKSGTVKVAAAGGANEIVIETAGTITIRASSQVTVAAPRIDLTSGASHPVVLGDVLQQHLLDIFKAYSSHVHLVFGMFPVTPTAQQFLPPLPTLLSTQVKTG